MVPLSPLQRKLLWFAALLVAATRVFALSKTLWDWDEAQFAGGVREFNVGHPVHHPHPPGFPVYMALAKLARLFASTDFAALQTIVLIAACALFPLAFFLARELRFPFWTSFAAAVMFVFLPNIWFYGGTGFSDIPGVALTMAAALMLLRGCRSPRDYLLGALLLGLAAGIRPQAVLLGAAPFAVASWIQFRSSWRRVVAACAIAGTTVIVCYAGVALASANVTAYITSVREVGDWVRARDAFTNPERPALVTLFDEYFIRPMGAGRIGFVVSVLAALGALRGLFRREEPRVGLAMLTFLPFAVFAYLSLDLNSIHRYSTAYLFLWALLAAHALAPIGRWPAAGQLALILLITARYAQWTGGLLMQVRGSDSPTYAAMTWTRDHVPPGKRVWVDGSLEPFAEYYLADRDVQIVSGGEEVLRHARGDEFYATEGVVPGAGSRRFIRDHGRVWDVARKRYFAASVMPVGNFWQFGEDWHDPEYLGDQTWRWMGRRGVIRIPPGAGRARVQVTVAAQAEIALNVEVALNGDVIDRFPLTPRPVTREWIVDSRADAPNELVFTSSAVMNPKALGRSDDARDLSLMLTSYVWQPM
jgi:Glycosyltransferase family 87